MIVSSLNGQTPAPVAGKTMHRRAVTKITLDGHASHYIREHGAIRASVGTRETRRVQPHDNVTEGHWFTQLIMLPGVARHEHSYEEAYFVLQGEGVMTVGVGFTAPQVLDVGDAVQRGLGRREREGRDIDTMGAVYIITVGRTDDRLKVVATRDNVMINPG